mgnify:FL=1|jgi:4-amino-4-deoxy-L-arabinose transferase-like glycosyltransferase|tara:strand:- start:2681 stop:4153 length:1473 start_codon:yes stop_codon:yes gene_type:complete
MTPVLDRDEARYAQTSFQISENNNFINLKFEDNLRLKKPPGIYWMQFASYKFFNNFFEKEIWMFRIPSFLSFILMLFFTHKLARLLFYDLNTMIPIAALSGTIIVMFEALQATTDMAYTAFSLMSYYYFLKSFHEEKKYSHILFVISGLIAMLIKGPIFLITIAVVIVFKLLDFDISIKKKIIQLSNISIIILVSVFLAILYNMLTEGQFLQQSLINDFGNKLISTQESHGGIYGYYFLGSFLIVFPIYPLLIIGIFFNFFKKINWDKNLIIILSSILLFMLSLELVPTKLPHYILPVVPLMAIYLSRTLEFIEFKWSKILLGLNIVLVLALIYLDLKAYEITGENRNNLSFLYYGLMIIPLTLNPFFFTNNQSLLNIIKMCSISSSFLVLITILNVIFLHKNIWIGNGIENYINRHYECNQNYNINITGINEPSLVFKFYENFNLKSDCNIKIQVSDSNNIPINDTASTNQSFFNYSNGKKINLNFSKQ